MDLELDGKVAVVTGAGKGIGQVTDHYVDVIGMLGRRPVMIGHSFGGLITQKIACMDLAVGAKRAPGVWATAFSPAGCCVAGGAERGAK